MQLFHRGILGIYPAFVASASGQNPFPDAALSGFASRANVATANERERDFLYREINISFTRTKLTYLHSVHDETFHFPA